MVVYKYSFVFVFAAVIHLSPSAGLAPVLKLNNGKEIPGFGIGTWLGTNSNELKGDEVQKSVEWAIDAGYRHIDTAAIYSTEDQVGRAIKKKIAEGVVKREDLFVTTKLWNTNHKKEAVLPALRKSLKNLDLDYVNLYLIHWPIALHENASISQTDYVETWQAMTDVLNQGLTKSIGVSNFNIQQLERLKSEGGVTPSVLQVEINLNLQQSALLDYCKAQGIVVVAYTPFGNLFNRQPSAPAPRADDQRLVAIAQKYKKTVPQIVLRYLVELGVIPIPKSLHKDRVEENIQIYDFSLTPDEIQLLKSFDNGYRTLSPLFWAHSPYFPFESKN